MSEHDSGSQQGVQGTEQRCCSVPNWGLTRALSTDHAPNGVRVNAICPGTIETPPVQRMMEDPRAHEVNIQAHALRRLGLPDEIANAALWLASDEASFVSGEAIVVDGGLRAQSPLGKMSDPRPAQRDCYLPGT